MHLEHSSYLASRPFSRNVIAGYPQYKMAHQTYLGATLPLKYQPMPFNHLLSSTFQFSHGKLSLIYRIKKMDRTQGNFY